MENFKRAFKLWNFNHKPEVNKEPEISPITGQYIAYYVNNSNT